MRLSFPRRALFFVCVSVVCMLVAGVIMAVVTHGGLTVRSLRVSTVVQDLVMFIIPPVVCAVMFSRLPARYLMVERRPGLAGIILAIGAMICAIPLMNLVIEWNEHLTLPSQLASLDEWMRASEERAGEAVKMLMGGGRVADLIMSVLIVGVLAGVSEELFFRGGVQRLLATRPMNIHLAVWLTAFLFSAIHLQFFGFFPRLLLGAFFGYLLYWSGSLWLPVTCHAVNNSIVAAVTWMETRGTSAGRMVNELGTAAGPPARWLWLGASLVLTVVMVIALHRVLDMDKMKSTGTSE